MEFPKGKGFCVFFNDVVCSFRKSDRVGVMDRCFKCSHFERHERMMDEQESEFWDYVDRVREFGIDRA